MRRTVLLLTVMAACLVMAGGVALAVSKVGTNGRDVFKGTDKKDSLLGLGGQDDLFGKGGDKNLDGGPRRQERDPVQQQAQSKQDVVVRGDGLDRVLADRKDAVARDCERVFFGLSDR